MVDYFSDDRFGGSNQGSVLTGSTDLADPATARLTSGGFVVTFLVGNAVWAQRYDADGAKLGTAALISSGGGGQSPAPSVAGLPGGGYVVTWGDSTSHIRAQLFDASGVATTAALNVGTTANQQWQSSVTALTNGDFVVAWSDLSLSAVRAQVFHADGQPVTGEIVPAAASGTTLPQVTALTGGGFVLAWTADSAAHAQSYSAAGVAQGSTVNIVTPASHHFSFYESVAALPGGGYVMTWTEGTDNSGETSNVMGQMFDANGVAAAAAFQVNSVTSYNAGRATVAPVDGGGFLVTWRLDVPGAGPNYFQTGDVEAQLFDAAGHKIGAEFQVAQAPANGQDFPVATAFGTGDMAVFWQTFDDFGGSTVASRMLYSVTNGTAAPNTMTGTPGVDFLHGLGSADVLVGLGGGDTLDGGDGNDQIYSGALSPTWLHTGYPTGDPVAPMLDTGTEVDTLLGGAGYDTLYAGYGDNVDGGADGGSLLISLQGATSGVTADFSTLLHNGSMVIGGGTITNITTIDWIDGSNFADTLTVDNENNSPTGPIDVRGLGGNDHLIATGGIGVALYGGDGDDTLEMPSVNGLHANGILDGGDGNDTILSGSYNSMSRGGAGNDTITSTGNAYGGAGDDVITSTAGDVYHAAYFGDGGNDTLNGSETDDLMGGGSGADVIYGNGGNDLLYSATADGSNYVFGNTNGLLITQEADTGIEHDRLFGGAGNDRLSIGYGDDADGGTGTNTLALSLLGATTGVTVDFTNLVNGGTLTIGGGTISHIQSVAAVWGSNYADTITLAGAGIVFGGGGADTINGSSGDDHIFGGSGADIIHAGNGNDTIGFFAADDVASGEVIDGGAGYDVIMVGGYDPVVGSIILSDVDLTGATFVGIEALNSVAQNTIVTTTQLRGLAIAGSFKIATGGVVDLTGTTLIPQTALNITLSDAGNTIDMSGLNAVGFVAGGAGNDVITIAGGSAGGGDGDDILTGGNNSGDSLFGGAGNDRLNGGGGNDNMVGGTGDDTYVVDSAGDVVTEMAGEGNDTVESSVTFFLNGRNIENLTLTGTGNINATGDSESSNVLTGNSGNNKLDGLGGGNGDRLIGGLGDDTYVIRSANDVIVEGVGAGTDTVQVSVSVPSFTLAPGVEVEKLTTLTPSGTTAMNLTGNEWSHDIEGNAGTNVLTGGSGQDLLYGFGGDDTLNGGAGGDAMYGGTGNDIYVVDNAGDQVIENAGEGTDTVIASIDFSLAAFANVENLTLTGTALRATGNAGQNTITGNAGSNVLDGGGGGDTLQGGAGNDVYYVRNAADVIVEGAGEGTADTALATVSYTLGANAQVERLATTDTNLTTAINLTGNAYSHLIQGNAGVNVLTGGSGNDNLFGYAGDDRLDGGQGADQMTGGIGNDTYVVDNAGDQVIENASEGTDTVEASVSYTLGANVENLTLTGANAIDGTGNAGANIIRGNSAANTLNGGGGADSLYGGGGDDTYVVDNAGVQIVENANEGTDTVRSSLSYTLGANLENLILTGTGSINGYGNAAQNIITGNAGSNVLDGAGGGDTLQGGAGNDVYYVRNAADVIVEGAGEGTADTVLASVSYTLTAAAQVERLAASDANATNAINLTGNAFVHLIQGNAGVNTLTGGSGNDSLYGYAGDDRLDGGQGTDTLYGGIGNDTYVVDSQSDVIVENANEGTDTVETAISYSLAAVANVENLTLTGTNAINGTGNALDNVIHGNSAANTLNGGGGTDMLYGGAGDDTYVIGDAHAKVFELAGEGNDTVQASVSYSLAGMSNIETLMLTGTGYINATGNAEHNTLIGNAVSNVLDGGGGGDTLQGGAGNDVYYVRNAGDVIVEGAGEGTADTVLATVSYTLNAGAQVERLAAADANATNAINLTGNDFAHTIQGNNGANVLTGGSGADTLFGYGGNDTLFGGAGADKFVFAHGTGQDSIGDFVAGTDKIDLTAIGFASYQDVINATHDVGGNAVIDLGNGDQVTLTGVTTAQLHSGDFIGVGNSAAAQMQPFALSFATVDTWHGGVETTSVLHG
jgi:Ca2+-binding RTX toxin-like protein